MRIALFAFGLVWFTACTISDHGINSPPVSIGSQEPHLVSTEYGLILSWMEPIDGDIHLRMSIFDGIRWAEPKTVASGYSWFVNWADFPAIAANGDNLFAHFLQISGENTYDYDIMFTQSSDRGKNWSTPKKLHSDTVSAEHGFVSAIPFQDGFYVSWLDGRFTKSASGAMSVRTAFLDVSGNLKNEQEVDHKTCDCCQTSMVNYAGTPYVFYRDRSDGEIRDIYYSYLNDNQWTEPISIHEDGWEINACPVNGPATASDGDNIVVAWYTGSDGKYDVKFRTSNDRGKSFNDTVLVDGPATFGRVDVKMMNNRIYLTYMRKRGDEAVIFLAEYSYSGELIANTPFATVSSERGTGFPRTAIWNDNFFVSWTDVDMKQVKVVEYPLD